jgi:hypothetical protein
LGAGTGMSGGEAAAGFGRHFSVLGIKAIEQMAE